MFRALLILWRYLWTVLNTKGMDFLKNKLLNNDQLEPLAANKFTFKLAWKIQYYQYFFNSIYLFNLKMGTEFWAQLFKKTIYSTVYKAIDFFGHLTNSRSRQENARFSTATINKTLETATFIRGTFWLVIEAFIHAVGVGSFLALQFTNGHTLLTVMA